MVIITKYENIVFKYKRSGADNPLNIKGHTQTVLMSRIKCETALSLKPYHKRYNCFMLNTQLTVGHAYTGAYRV